MGAGQKAGLFLILAGSGVIFFAILDFFGIFLLSMLISDVLIFLIRACLLALIVVAGALLITAETKNRADIVAGILLMISGTLSIISSITFICYDFNWINSRTLLISDFFTSWGGGGCAIAAGIVLLAMTSNTMKTRLAGVLILVFGVGPISLYIIEGFLPSSVMTFYTAVYIIPFIEMMFYACLIVAGVLFLIDRDKIVEKGH